MPTEHLVKRTDSGDTDFQSLVKQLDHELWVELEEDQAQYDQYNKVPDLPTVIVVYMDGEAAACGCFKKYNEDTVEIKRMYVQKQFRRQGLSKVVLSELEKWAGEAGYKFAILETSIHFTPAVTLYRSSGYQVIPNYDQYANLPESICMRKNLQEPLLQKEDAYFNFEKDFVSDGVRCIPMIVRFKMDKAGIKLKLAEWAKLDEEERLQLGAMPASDPASLDTYRRYLTNLVTGKTGEAPTYFDPEELAEWARLDQVPPVINAKLQDLHRAEIPVDAWKKLGELQRFALYKLVGAEHESKNLGKALVEFGLASS